MPKNMSLNAVLANIIAHDTLGSEITFTPEDFARVQANAVSPAKIAILDAYENGEPLPALDTLPTSALPEHIAVTVPAKPARARVSATVNAPGPVQSNTQGTRSPLNRTRDQIDRAGELNDAAYAGLLVRVGNAKKARILTEGQAMPAKAVRITYNDACTLEGIPTRKNGLVNA